MRKRPLQQRAPRGAGRQRSARESLDADGEAWCHFVCCSQWRGGSLTLDACDERSDDVDRQMMKSRPAADNRNGTLVRWCGVRCIHKDIAVTGEELRPFHV